MVGLPFGATGTTVPSGWTTVPSATFAYKRIHVPSAGLVTKMGSPRAFVAKSIVGFARWLQRALVAKLINLVQSLVEVAVSVNLFSRC